MGNDIYKTTIKHLSTFFDSQLDADNSAASVFKQLKKIIDFDEGYIFFLNPDNISLKYFFSKTKNLALDDSFTINTNLKKDLFSFSNKILEQEHELIDLLKLSNNKSFLLSKLVIRNTVYGFMLLCKSEENFYNEEHIDVSSAISSVLSYKIKDAELSEIFKIQLKAMKDNFIETQAAYKTIQDQNVKILESDKIKNDFLANISHELRTPLNAIIGFSEMLSTKFFGELNEKQSEYVKDIHVSGIHLLGMINEVLDISKLEAKAMTLNKSEFLISRAVDEVLNVINPLAVKKSIVLKKNLSKDENIFADFQKIKQILYNLLSNAIKFTGKKGKVEVNVKVSAKSLIIEVADNGIGIALKDQSKIFGKFVQLENAYTKTESSTGLGLTITKEFVEMQGGSITLQSEPKKGSTFTVKLPLNK